MGALSFVLTQASERWEGMRIELAFQPGFQGRADVSRLEPDSVLRMSMKQLEHQTISVANTPVLLTEVCVIHRTIDKSDELVFSGETQSLIKVGHSMKGGRLTIEGNTGDELGVSMSAGVIQVHGSVGDWCGANENPNSFGMRGGMILVDGGAGDQVGAGMRRGLILITKNAGQYVGARMGAGTILCGGKLGKYPGLEMKRGSIITSKANDLLPGFLAAGKADEEWLRICYSELRNKGLNLPEMWLKKIPMRFTGDHLEMGKGEILIYDQVE
jgi:formylmethanofuran dehydrogenase subunit C